MLQRTKNLNNFLKYDNWILSLLLASRILQKYIILDSLLWLIKLKYLTLSLRPDLSLIT